MFLIFLTGACVLTLEVLSSRILTPYFGVSLYIWAGILSTTLSFLAAGYFLGGRLAKRFDKTEITSAFFHLPIFSAASILAASVIYPFLFPALAEMNLVVGSFIASVVLLAMPLVCLSAMNPILISMRAKEFRQGDGGAGMVFFVSTAGSVVGVGLTAFVIIPNIINFSALLWLALFLCVSTAAFSFDASSLNRRQRTRLLSTAAVVSIVSWGLIIAQGSYLDLLADGEDGQKTRIVSEYTSVFGNIKVVDITSADQGTKTVRMFLQDGIIQNRTTLDYTSISMYTYVLDRLAANFSPNAKTALVLGLGAGIVPRDLQQRGIDVTVVEINQDAVDAATTHFGFRSNDFNLHIADARTFVRRCPPDFDVVVIDLFQGDSTPEYLMTSEFFRDVQRCIRKNGAIIMNAFLDDNDMTPNKRILATVATAFPVVVSFHLPDVNSFIVATTGGMPDRLQVSAQNIPFSLLNIVSQSVRSGQLVPPRSLLGYLPITDQQNVAALIMANSQMRRRRDIARYFPRRLLVN